MLGRISSAKLTRENHCGIWPLTNIGNGGYEIDDGWKVIGYCDAPWKSATSSTAIVFEKTSPARETFNELDPGIYWTHISNPERIKFLK